MNRYNRRQGDVEMLTWFSENLVNIVIIAVLVLVVGLLIKGMIRDKKEGKSCCGGNCASCGGCSSAHKIQNPQNVQNNRLIQTKVEVEGMMCGMCEAHVNDAVRKAIPVRKVNSSHTKGETMILTEGMPDSELIRRAIDNTGYTVRSIESHPYLDRKTLKLGFQ